MSGEFDQERTIGISASHGDKEVSYAWGDPNHPQNEGKLHGWLDAGGFLTPAGEKELEQQRQKGAARLMDKFSKLKASSGGKPVKLDKHGVPIISSKPDVSKKRE